MHSAKAKTPLKHLHMLLSMTGYGRESQPYLDKNITVEIRSLNSKFTDIKLKLPQKYKDRENDLRRILAERAERGKIEFALDIKSMHGDDDFALNVPLFRRYVTELQKLAGEFQLPGNDIIAAVLRLPSVVSTELVNIDEAEWAAVQAVVDKAVQQFDQFRLAEGKAMENDLLMRVGHIRSGLALVDPHQEERVTKVRQRLHQNLEDYLGKDKVDENRFEQEIIFYLEKMDITEEKVRLEQHCNYFLEELGSEETAKGRKLSFISQEMGREINTLGAKAYSSDIQRLVVQMKDELEKIKELVANIL
jgi:uncharacterized protein (TIGR00255 family)